MRSILTRRNLDATAEWLRANEPHFEAMDQEDAAIALSRLIERRLNPITLDVADTDTVHEGVWRGVMAVVSAGQIHGRDDDQRHVILYVSLENAGPAGIVELD